MAIENERLFSSSFRRRIKTGWEMSLRGFFCDKVKLSVYFKKWNKREKVQTQKKWNKIFRNESS